jgi:hypothetical protein
MVGVIRRASLDVPVMFLSNLQHALLAEEAARPEGHDGN